MDSFQPRRPRSLWFNKGAMSDKEPSRLSTQQKEVRKGGDTYTVSTQPRPKPPPAATPPKEKSQSK
jgi:hypothetical protein